MEHWVFEPEVLKVYAKHYQTGEVIPADLIENLIKVVNMDKVLLPQNIWQHLYWIWISMY